MKMTSDKYFPIENINTTNFQAIEIANILIRPRKTFSPDISTYESIENLKELKKYGPFREKFLSVNHAKWQKP